MSVSFATVHARLAPRRYASPPLRMVVMNVLLIACERVGVFALSYMSSLLLSVSLPLFLRVCVCVSEEKSNQSSRLSDLINIRISLT